MTRFQLLSVVTMAVAALATACEADPQSPEDRDEVDTGIATDDAASETGPPPVADDDTAIPLRPRSNPSEYVGLGFSRPMAFSEIDGLLSGIYGADAAAGRTHNAFELNPGVTLSVSSDPRTPEQVILQIDMEVTTDATPSRRTVFRGPVSFAYGELFIEATRAAATRAPEDDEDGPPRFRLEHRTRSANGGELTLGVEHDAGGPRLVVEVRSPRTSLALGSINEPMFSGPPWESIYGLVHFNLSRDNFDFFVNRAYGLSAGSGQNFRDFRLLPHDWLRLTVEPQLDDEMVNVGFELVATEGHRVPVARAPASVRAGEQFMQNVFLMVDTMATQEALAAGSSTPWEVPFYYDDPQGGGVVEVIATGRAGVFSIAYAVESPVNTLEDVEFLPYQGDIQIPEDWDAVDPTCGELGSEPSPSGMFHVTFDASSTVRTSTNQEGLSGPVWGSVFRAEDVTLLGPNPGARSVASFHFPHVDVTDGPDPNVHIIDTQLLAGDYQILGFMDTDSNADLDDPDPDTGDPVFIPIGSYRLECLVQPTVVEFAIRRP